MSRFWWQHDVGYGNWTLLEAGYYVLKETRAGVLMKRVRQGNWQRVRKQPPKRWSDGKRV